MFKDRREAGLLLARRLENYRGSDSIVMAIPRGGVVVAWEIAKYLDLPLDIICVKKISHPTEPELALGAVSASGETYMDQGTVFSSVVPTHYLDKVIMLRQKEAKEREEKYRSGKQALKVSGKNIILVDDGVATGSTILVAIRELKKKKAKRIVVAVPVAPTGIIQDLSLTLGQVVVLETPEPFLAVGNFYEDFSQVSDEEVKALLKN